MHGSGIAIWFFIGVLLFVYGVMVFGYGIYELATGTLAPVELSYLHTPVWWGALLTVLGLVYIVKFRPGRQSK
ncbi:MAG: hypothetical protein WCE75_14570 [Terracidiphilus sp.]